MAIMKKATPAAAKPAPAPVAAKPAPGVTPAAKAAPVKAAPPKPAAAKAAPVKAAPPKPAAAKAVEPAPAPEPEVTFPTVGKKEIAALARDHIIKLGKAIPPKLAEDMVVGIAAAIHILVSQENNVSLPGIGTFALTAKPEGTARNPATGAEVPVAAHNAVRLKIAGALKKAAKGELSGAAESDEAGEEEAE